MPYRKYITEIEGVTGKDPNAKARRRVLSSCRLGEKLILKHRPMLSDENAIEACRLDGTRIGWLSQTVEDEIVNLVDRGEELTVKIHKIDLGLWPFSRNIICTVRILAHFPKGS
jgi:hypothetical protein